jgi:hypothetical protein
MAKGSKIHRCIINQETRYLVDYVSLGDELSKPTTIINELHINANINIRPKHHIQYSSLIATNAKPTATYTASAP